MSKEENVALAAVGASKDIYTPKERRKRILIVEDEAVIAVMFEDALRDAGYETATAFDGLMALNLMKMSQSPFDAVVTDMRLPGPVSGLDIARRSRELNETTGVIFVTADSFTDWEETVVEGSIRHDKPITLKDLIASVAQVLASPMRPVSV